MVFWMGLALAGSECAAEDCTALWAQQVEAFLGHGEGAASEDGVTSVTREVYAERAWRPWPNGSWRGFDTADGRRVAVGQRWRAVRWWIEGEEPVFVEVPKICGSPRLFEDEVWLRAGEDCDVVGVLALDGTLQRRFRHPGVARREVWRGGVEPPVVGGRTQKRREKRTLGWELPGRGWGRPSAFDTVEIQVKGPPGTTVWAVEDCSSSRGFHWARDLEGDEPLGCRSGPPVRIGASGETRVRLGGAPGEQLVFAGDGKLAYLDVERAHDQVVSVPWAEEMRGWGGGDTKIHEAREVQVLQDGVPNVDAFISFSGTLLAVDGEARGWASAESRASDGTSYGSRSATALLETPAPHRICRVTNSEGGAIRQGPCPLMPFAAWDQEGLDVTVVSKTRHAMDLLLQPRRRCLYWFGGELRGYRDGALVWSGGVAEELMQQEVCDVPAGELHLVWRGEFSLCRDQVVSVPDRAAKRLGDEACDATSLSLLRKAEGQRSWADHSVLVAQESDGGEVVLRSRQPVAAHRLDEVPRPPRSLRPWERDEAPPAVSSWDGPAVLPWSSELAQGVWRLEDGGDAFIKRFEVEVLEATPHAGLLQVRGYLVRGFTAWRTGENELYVLGLGTLVKKKRDNR